MDGRSPAAVKLGWLWFDDDPRTTVQEKVSTAAARFQQKFGRAPALCYVNERDLAQGLGTAGLELAAASNVRPGHFLFVVEAAPAAS